MLEAITDPVLQFANVLNRMWPNLLATLFVLVFGWIVAKVLKLMFVKGLKLARLDTVSEKAGIEAFLKKGGLQQSASDILGSILYWIAFIIVLIMVLGIWNIDIGLSRTIIPFLPKIFAALVIFILGLFLASLIEDIVRATAANSGIKYAFFLSKTVKWILVIFVVLTSIQQLEIQTELFSWGFLIILGSLGLGLALAIGLGAKDIVGRKLNKWVLDLEREAQNAALTTKPAEEE